MQSEKSYILEKKKKKSGPCLCLGFLPSSCLPDEIVLSRGIARFLRYFAWCAWEPATKQGLFLDTLNFIY